MPDWNGVLQAGIVAAISAVAGTVYLLWKVRRHRAELRAGKPVTFDAFLRAHAPPYPARWRAGWITVGLGPITWKPRFSVTRPRVTLPASAVIERIRPASGFWENLMTNPGCRVIVAQGDGVNLEIAVLEIELATALRALESGSGGGWRLPAGMPPLC